MFSPWQVRWNCDTQLLCWNLLGYGNAIYSIWIAERPSLVGDGKVDALLYIKAHTPGLGPFKYCEEILMEEGLIFRWLDVTVEYAVISEKSDCRYYLTSDVVDEQQEQNRSEHWSLWDARHYRTPVGFFPINSNTMWPVSQEASNAVICFATHRITAIYEEGIYGTPCRMSY